MRRTPVRPHRKRRHWHFFFFFAPVLLFIASGLRVCACCVRAWPGCLAVLYFMCVYKRCCCCDAVSENDSGFEPLEALSFPITEASDPAVDMAAARSVARLLGCLSVSHPRQSTRKKKVGASLSCCGFLFFASLRFAAALSFSFFLSLLAVSAYSLLLRPKEEVEEEKDREEDNTSADGVRLPVRGCVCLQRSRAGVAHSHFSKLGDSGLGG